MKNSFSSEILSLSSSFAKFFHVTLATFERLALATCLRRLIKSQKFLESRCIHQFDTYDKLKCDFDKYSGEEAALYSTKTLFISDLSSKV